MGHAHEGLLLLRERERERERKREKERERERARATARVVESGMTIDTLHTRARETAKAGPR